MIPQLVELARIMRACETQPGGCWVYGRSVAGNGYPQARNRQQAHRFVYEVLHGITLPPDHDAHHLCEEKRCMNPRHIQILQHEEHIRLHNPSGRGSKTHCGKCGDLKTIRVIERDKVLMRCDRCRKAAQRRADAKRRTRV